MRLYNCMVYQLYNLTAETILTQKIPIDIDQIHKKLKYYRFYRIVWNVVLTFFPYFLVDHRIYDKLNFLKLFL